MLLSLTFKNFTKSSLELRVVVWYSAINESKDTNYLNYLLEIIKIYCLVQLVHLIIYQHAINLTSDGILLHSNQNVSLIT